MVVLGTSINNGVVTSVLVLPDGDVIASGTFTLAGGAAAGRIARYNPGTNTWSDMNGGVSGGSQQRGRPGADAERGRCGGRDVHGGGWGGRRSYRAVPALDQPVVRVRLGH